MKHQFSYYLVIPPNYNKIISRSIDYTYNCIRVFLGHPAIFFSKSASKNVQKALQGTDPDRLLKGSLWFFQIWGWLPWIRPVLPISEIRKTIPLLGDEIGITAQAQDKTIKNIKICQSNEKLVLSQRSKKCISTTYAYAH